MKLKPRTIYSVCLALLFSAAAIQAQTPMLSSGHTDLALDYDAAGGVWDLHVGSDETGAEYAASNIVLQVRSQARTLVPSDPKFSFLGNSNTTIWLLPQTQNEELLYLGYGGDGIPDGVFAGNQVKVTLQSVTGPGDFFSYKVDGFGNPTVYFNTRDGISTNDTINVQAGGDAHLNWAFTAPGDYTVVIEASGTLVAGNKATSSGPVAYSFSVEPATILSAGHTDLALEYTETNNVWNLHLGQDETMAEFDANAVVLKVKSAAKTTVPTDAKFSFLGVGGAPVWILPQAQNEELLYLGYGGDDIPDGAFVGNQVQVTLKSLTGPGDFFSYKVDGFGNPVVYFNTRDGISTNDTVSVQAGGDAHLNWAFTAPGTYTAIIEASGTLVAGNKATSSGPVAYTFEVASDPAILSSGHTDLALDYDAESDAWDFHVGSDETGQEFDADDVILQVKGEAKTTVPTDAKFSFLGSAGAPIWILPQAQNEELLYLGYGGDGIPDGIFVGNQVTVTLKSVSGPGNFFSYRVDGFGNPAVLFNTADGISTNDQAVVQSGGDAHLNWAFTAAGDYTVVLEASGVLANGNKATSSGPVTFHFSVLTPIVELVNEHVDLRVIFDPAATNQMTLVARDEDHHINYASNEVYLVVGESSKLTLPAGTPFGNAGDNLWIIPQSQNPDLLYLGISAEGIPEDAFTGNLNFRLRSVDGPGDFLVWQASQFGDFNVRMNTKDGITDADGTTPLIGSHEHYNWGFSTTGVYRVTFQVSGQRAGSTNVVSPDTTFTFHVLPLPTNAPPAEIELRNPKLLSDGSFTFNIMGPASSSIDIQATENFAQWTSVTSLVLTGLPQPVTVPAVAGKPYRFFRAQKR